jgi:hypothetical protein
MTIGRLGSHDEYKIPIISMTLLTPAKLEEKLVKTKIAEQCRKRKLAMTEKKQCVAVAKEDEERMIHAAIVRIFLMSLFQCIRGVNR